MSTRVVIRATLSLLGMAALWGCAQNDSVDSFHETQIRWEFETTSAITSSPAVAYDKVYIRTADSVIALDAATGRQLWTAESPGETPLGLSPSVEREVLIVPERQSRLAAFSANTGRLLWRTDLIDTILTRPTAIGIRDVVLSQGLLYVARFDWAVTAYDASSGSTVWEYYIEGRQDPYLAADSRYLYVGTGSHVAALDRLTAGVAWVFDFEGYVGPILVVGDTLYVIDEANSRLVAIDTSKQSQAWAVAVPEEEFEFNCLSNYSGELYIAAKSLLAVSSSDGELIWQTKNLGRLECPVLLEHHIYVRNTGPQLFLLDRSSAAEIDTFAVAPNTSMKNRPNRGPALADGLLIVPVSERRIIAVLVD